jgi:hypothetical protein
VSGGVAYVGSGTNEAPSVAFGPTSLVGVVATFNGTVTDTAPDTVAVELSSNLSGALGAATVTSTGNTLTTVQTTSWSLGPVTLSPGSHTISACGRDEGGIVRCATTAITVP